jgi:chromate reductase
MSDIQILGIAGSLRAGSFNSGLIRAAVDVARDGIQVEQFDLADIPLYNGDLDLASRPDAVVELMNKIADADALLFASPEYLGSYSGVLKNAIDWASRPFERPVFAEKQVAVMGAGGGAGATKSQAMLRQLLMGLGCYVLPRPQVNVSFLSTKFSTAGDLEDPEVRHAIEGLVESLANFARRLRTD